MPMNYAKTALLLAALTAIFVAVGAAVGGRSGLILAFVFALGMNVLSLWKSDTAVLRMFKAQQVDDRTAPELVGVVREMAQHKYGSAVIMQNHKVVGIFTTVDVCKAFAELLHTRLAK